MSEDGGSTTQFTLQLRLPRWRRAADERLRWAAASARPPVNPARVSRSTSSSTGARGHFPTDQAALKVLYLAVVSLDPTGKGRQRWTNRWKAALNAFDIAFDGRITANRR
jgi:hypothetical protein